MRHLALAVAEGWAGAMYGSRRCCSPVHSKTCTRPCLPSGWSLDEGGDYCSGGWKGVTFNLEGSITAL